MKFFARRRSLTNQSVERKTTRSVSTDSVDFTVVSDSSCSSWGKRVHFAGPEHNQSYESPWTIVKRNVDDDELEQEQNSNKTIVVQHSVWYTKTDVGCFKSDAQVSVRVFQARERQGATTSTWAQTMWDAYLALDNVTSVDEMNAIMDTAHSVHIEAEHVGLEKWLRNGATFRAKQRKDLQGDFVEAQATGRASERCLRRLCREKSRTSRLYAIYVARAVAP